MKIDWSNFGVKSVTGEPVRLDGKPVNPTCSKSNKKVNSKMTFTQEQVKFIKNLMINEINTRPDASENRLKNILTRDLFDTSIDVKDDCLYCNDFIFY